MSAQAQTAAGAVTLMAGDCLTWLATLDDASVDAVITDPPYELGFMGKRWDGTGIAFNIAVWQQCLRVLKPGGHLLAFGGSRTWHRLAVAIEDAGFELRDHIAWLYSQGFPKSVDVTDAMTHYLTGGPSAPAPDCAAPADTGTADVYRVTGFLRDARDRAGWTNRRIDALFGTNGMAGHWTSAGAQPACPSLRQWAILKDALGFSDEYDTLVATLAGTERTEEPPRPVADTRSGKGRFLDTLHKDTAFGSAGGWGTALKPAFEPVVVARKPLSGAVAANVLAYGTGALHIDACRVGEHGATVSVGAPNHRNAVYGQGMGGLKAVDAGKGRWPTNVVLDEHIATVLDEQTPSVKDGASQFFPVFKYQPKAPKRERPRIDVDGQPLMHPTVKPLALMKWLVQLIVPEDGVVLDPFAGSGTTLQAARDLGRTCIGIERETDYLPLIRQRLGLDPAIAAEAEIRVPTTGSPISAGDV